MSPERPRWKPFVCLAKWACVLATALLAAPLPWPKPAEAQSESNDEELAQNDEGIQDWLLGDLERGRWKASDPVSAIHSRHGYKVERFMHGDFITITGPVLLRGEYEVIALRGRLKAAGVWYLPLHLVGDPYDKVYFDTLTKEERAAYNASYQRALNRQWATTPNGILWYTKSFLIGPGRLSSFGR